MCSMCYTIFRTLTIQIFPYTTRLCQELCIPTATLLGPPFRFFTKKLRCKKCFILEIQEKTKIKVKNTSSSQKNEKRVKALVNLNYVMTSFITRDNYLGSGRMLNQAILRGLLVFLVSVLNSFQCSH